MFALIPAAHALRPLASVVRAGPLLRPQHLELRARLVSAPRRAASFQSSWSIPALFTNAQVRAAPQAEKDDAILWAEAEARESQPPKSEPFESSAARNGRPAHNDRKRDQDVASGGPRQDPVCITAVGIPRLNRHQPTTTPAPPPSTSLSVPSRPRSSQPRPASAPAQAQGAPAPAINNPFPTFGEYADQLHLYAVERTLLQAASHIEMGAALARPGFPPVRRHLLAALDQQLAALAANFAAGKRLPLISHVDHATLVRTRYTPPAWAAQALYRAGGGIVQLEAAGRMLARAREVEARLRGEVERDVAAVERRSPK